MSNLEYNLYQFSRKVFKTLPLLKCPCHLPLHQKLEKDTLGHTSINIRKSKYNFMKLGKGIELLLEKVDTNKIIIKPADEGSMTVVMTPKDY